MVAIAMMVLDIQGIVSMTMDIQGVTYSVHGCRPDYHKLSPHH